MKAIFKPPKKPYMGNLFWNIMEAQEFSAEIMSSLEKIRAKKYWVSLFPEGDGLAFGDEQNSRKHMDMLNDFVVCFCWLKISLDLTFSTENVKNKPAESKLSFEKKVILSKKHIALVQLEDAIELFMLGKRLSAITLAGAADGIFVGLLKQCGEKNSAEDSWQYIEKVRANTGMDYAGKRTKKEAFNEWNESRNRLKHHDNRDEEILEFSAFDQAYYAIQRANIDANKLGVEAKNRQNYEKWLIKTIYM